MDGILQPFPNYRDIYLYYTPQKGHGELPESKERAHLHNGEKLGRLWASAHKLSAQFCKSPDALFCVMGCREI